MAKDGAMPQDPHAEKRLAKLKALLDYLIDPTNWKSNINLLRGRQLVEATGIYSYHMMFTDIETRNSLLNKEANAWIKLFNETSKFDSLKDLYEQAAKKYGFCIKFTELKRKFFKDTSVIEHSDGTSSLIDHKNGMIQGRDEII